MSGKTAPILVAVLIATVILASLASTEAEPVKVIFDTDMADDCDDAGGLAVLNALADLGEAEILAVVTNRKEPGNSSAGAADAINTWYGRPDIPIGTDKHGVRVRWSAKPSIYAGRLREEFSNDIGPDSQAPDALAICRKTLASQEDGGVVICSVGALSNLEDLLRSGPDEFSDLTGYELIETKVKETFIMGGGFPRTMKPETNLLLDPAAAVAVAAEWPGPITWQGFEVGAAIVLGPELKTTSETSPVRRAYELRPYHGSPSLDIGKPAHDLATVLLAVRGPQPELWKVTEKGRALIDSDGNSEWKTDRVKAHRYVSINGHPEKLEKAIGELLARAPANQAGQAAE